MDSKDPKKSNKLALQNNVSQIKFAECEKILREHYKIPDEVCLKYSKIDFDPKLNVNPETKKNASDTSVAKESGISVAVDIYSCANNQKLDKTLCDKVETSSCVPLPKDSTFGNNIKKSTKELSKYKINFGKSNKNNNKRFLIDITNQQDPIFNDKCIKFSSSNGQTLTVNERRKTFYPNTTLSCGIQNLNQNQTNDNTTCVYAGLDENNYSVCDCTGVQETKNLFEEALLESISDINIGIVICYAEILIFVIYYF